MADTKYHAAACTVKGHILNPTVCRTTHAEVGPHGAPPTLRTYIGQGQEEAIARSHRGERLFELGRDFDPDCVFGSVKWMNGLDKVMHLYIPASMSFLGVDHTAPLPSPLAESLLDPGVSRWQRVIRVQCQIECPLGCIDLGNCPLGKGQGIVIDHQAAYGDILTRMQPNEVIRGRIDQACAIAVNGDPLYVGQFNLVIATGVLFEPVGLLL